MGRASKTEISTRTNNLPSSLAAVTNAMYEDVALELLGADSIDGGDDIAAEAQAVGAEIY